MDRTSGGIPAFDPLAFNGLWHSSIAFHSGGSGDHRADAHTDPNSHPHSYAYSYQDPHCHPHGDAYSCQPGNSNARHDLAGDHILTSCFDTSS